MPRSVSVGPVMQNYGSLFEKIVPLNRKIKTYKSPPIYVIGTARYSVTFGTASVPVEWHIVNGTCEPILAGNKGIIQFRGESNVFHVQMQASQWSSSEIQKKYRQKMGKIQKNTEKIQKNSLKYITFCIFLKEKSCIREFF